MEGERDRLAERLEEMAPGLGPLLQAYTAALGPFAKAQEQLTAFISDKPELVRKFSLIGQIAETTGQQLTEEEVLDILVSDE